MENCILRFDIIPDGYSYDNFELPHYPFELDLGNIDPLKFSQDSLDKRKGYSIEECFKEAGVDVELLKSLEEFSGSDVKYIYFPPGNSIAHTFEQPDQAVSEVKRLLRAEYKSLFKRASGCFENGKAIIVGELNYVEKNYEGHKFQRTNQLKHFVDLTKNTPLTQKKVNDELGAPIPPSFEYSIGFENQEENYNKVNYKFATHKDNYQVVLPEISYSLTPGEADRFLVYIEVEKSSIHDFDIILMYNNSEQLKSQDIKLELFRPVQWSD